MAIIYSTATNDTAFSFYAKQKESEKKVSVRKIEKTIIIKGSLNQEVKSKRGKYGETEVTAEELKLLKEHKQYLKGVASGFYSEKAPVSPKKDKSAQLTQEKVKGMTKADVKTGKEAV